MVTTGGLLITAAHVAGGARILDVTNSTGVHGFLAPVIAASGSDVASVGVPASWPQLREASADAAVGDEVVVAGRSSGSTVVRHARVEAILHGRGPDDPAQVVRLDVGVAPGDSGGPVVDASQLETDQRRQLGREVLTRLYEGDAETFVVLATSLAAESKRTLTGPPIRARVALALELPLGSGVPSDALALALISRPDLRREWVSDPAMGSLPSRRLAARLLERAARESARRDRSARRLERPVRAHAAAHAAARAEAESR